MRSLVLYKKETCPFCRKVMGFISSAGRTSCTGTLLRILMLLMNWSAWEENARSPACSLTESLCMEDMEVGVQVRKSRESAH